MSSIAEFEKLLNHLYNRDEIKAIYKLLDENNKTQDLQTLNRLQNGEPVQYVLGFGWFYNRQFALNSSTLIPRPETEELCYLILNEAKNAALNGCEIGTGSGCIPITLAAENENARFIATDISSHALQIANQNAVAHGVDGRIQFIEHNFLTDSIPGIDFDLIVSNPPYINRKESAEMTAVVLRWEPWQALFPEGDDPFIFYSGLFNLLNRQTNINCELWAEINPFFTERLEAYKQQGFHVEIHTDISGHARFLRAKKKGH